MTRQSNIEHHFMSQQLHNTSCQVTTIIHITTTSLQKQQTAGNVTIITQNIMSCHNDNTEHHVISQQSHRSSCLVTIIPQNIMSCHNNHTSCHATKIPQNIMSCHNNHTEHYLMSQQSHIKHHIISQQSLRTSSYVTTIINSIT